MNEKEFLEQYDGSKYESPSVTVDVSVFSLFSEPCTNYRKLPDIKLKLLLIKRGMYPYNGLYALPGGFLKSSETLEDAAYRELYEETGVNCNRLIQLRTFSEPKRDPRKRIITCAYTALIDSTNLRLQSGTDAEQAKWFEIYLHRKEVNDELIWNLILINGNDRLEATIRECPQKKVDEIPGLEIVSSNGLAFDHALIISYSLIKLRERIYYEPIVLDLLPKQFTLTEAQHAYEAILDEKLYPQAFRRKIAQAVIETDDYTNTRGHRPSKLFVAKR